MESSPVNGRFAPFFKPLSHISIVSYDLALTIYYYNIRGDVCLDELRLWIYGQLIIHSWLGFVAFYHQFERSFDPLHRYRGKLLSLVLKVWWVLFGIFLLYSARACVFLAPLLYWSVGSGVLVMSIFIAIELKRPGGVLPPALASTVPLSAPPAIPVTSFCRGESGTIESCSICIEIFEQDEFVSRLSCGHLYHSSCISKWLQTAARSLRSELHCPLCRSPI